MSYLLNADLVESGLHKMGVDADNTEYTRLLKVQ